MRDENGRVVGYRDLDRLGTTLAPVLIRRRKREVMAQLPERLEKTFFVLMTHEQLVHHRENQEIVARIAAKWRRSRHLSERDQRRLMIALQRMRMSCDSSYLLDEESDHGTKAGEILTLLGEIFEEPGTKVVIFSPWLRMHEILAKRVAAAGWGHVLFHGGIDSRARGKLVDRFRDDPQCRIFLSTDASGVGLNLQHASFVVNVDLPWNPAVLEQRIGRVHRIGQRAPVRVVNFVAEGTIEQGMLSVLRFKKSLFAGVLDGGETEVFLGKGRLDRFMESIERVTAEIQPAPVVWETPADVAAPEASVPEAAPPALAEPLVDPIARLLESGVGFLRQLEAALPADANPRGDGKSTVRRIEAWQDADGSTFSQCRCRAARPSRVSPTAWPRCCGACCHEPAHRAAKGQRAERQIDIDPLPQSAVKACACSEQSPLHPQSWVKSIRRPASMSASASAPLTTASMSLVTLKRGSHYEVVPLTVNP